ncbi:MAG TPA: metallophosphoesterase [Gemmatimonadaceae bacterium]|nr:metallophosphoesterase [Gemmatimonadaceae bacterium]
MATSGDVVRVAAMSDVHYAKSSAGALQPVFAKVTEQADVLVLCGDLTDYGMVEEAKVLAKDLTSTVKIPIVGVLGNHDFEAGQESEIAKILTDAGVTVLDGDSTEIHGVGFAGVRGFCGGFGRGALGAWGEPIIKQFVHEAVNETLKLETALARLKTEHRIAIIHYAPIQATVQGEPEVIYPFLGSSRLEEPLGRYQVSAVFHGHAHKGTVEGRTSTGIPVYNVALPLLKATYPDRAPFWLLDLPVRSAARDESSEERRHGGRRASDREATGTPRLSA